MPATLLFAIANIPMLMKHGLSAEKAEADPPLPPQG
jgi:intracellular septation protein